MFARVRMHVVRRNMMDLDANLARLAAAPLPDLSAIDGGALAVRDRDFAGHRESNVAQHQRGTAHV